jgi:hypothetical protein
MVPLTHGLEDCTLHQRFKERQLIRILAKRRGAVERCAGGTNCGCLVDPPTDQRGFGFLGAMRHRRRCAENNRGALADAVCVNVEHGLRLASTRVDPLCRSRCSTFKHRTDEGNLARDKIEKGAHARCLAHFFMNDEVEWRREVR